MGITQNRQTGNTPLIAIIEPIVVDVDTFRKVVVSLTLHFDMNQYPGCFYAPLWRYLYQLVNPPGACFRLSDNLL